MKHFGSECMCVSVCPNNKRWTIMTTIFGTLVGVDPMQVKVKVVDQFRT